MIFAFAWSSASGFALATPVRHVVLDVEDTLIQEEPGSGLEPIPIDSAKTYYLKPGVRKFLEYLARESRAGNLDFSFVARMPQAELNTLLSGITLDAQPLKDICHAAIGSVDLGAPSILGLLPDESAILLIDEKRELQGPLAEHAVRIRGSSETAQSQEIERYQYDLMRWLMEDAKTRPQPNGYRDWSQLVAMPYIASKEKYHFQYLIPDLLKDDRPGDTILVLGRDTDAFYAALQAAKDKLDASAKVVYLPLSRAITKQGPSQLLKVLRAGGIDVDTLKNGQGHLRIVDTGHSGTVPKQIIRALYANDPQWEKKVKSVTAFLMTSTTPGAEPAGRFSDLESYLAKGAFMETTPHQYRLGGSRFRRDVLFWEQHRPHKFYRVGAADPDGRIKTTATLPGEDRFSKALDEYMALAFSDPETIEEMKRRIAFLHGVPGKYPESWREWEPDLDSLGRPGPAAQKIRQTVTDAKILAALEAKKALSQIIRPDLSESGPDFVTRVKDRRNPDNLKLDYDPGFDHGKLDTASPVEKYPDLDMGEAPKVRAATLAYSRAMDRQDASASGHDDLVLGNANRRFADPGDLENFLLSLAKVHAASPATGQAVEFRQTAGPSGIARSPQRLEKDWPWFTHWLFNRLKSDYDPFVLGSQVYYLLANEIQPFKEGSDSTAKDLVDWLFVHQGVMPPRWSEVPRQRLSTGPASPRQSARLLLEALEPYGPRISIRAPGIIRKVLLNARKTACIRTVLEGLLRPAGGNP